MFWDHGQSRFREAPHPAIVGHPFGTDCPRSLWVSASCFVAEKPRQRESQRKRETQRDRDRWRDEATLSVTALLSMKGGERVGLRVGV